MAASGRSGKRDREISAGVFCTAGDCGDRIFSRFSEFFHGRACEHIPLPGHLQRCTGLDVFHAPGA